MTIASGKLNRRIAIQRRGSEQDDAGEPVGVWVEVARVWADVAGSSGLLTIRTSGDVPAAIKRYSFRIRFREGLDEKMRVVYDGQNFDIKAVRMDFAQRQWTDLVCELGANDG